MLFDSHTHLNFKAFDNTWKEVISDCQKNNVWMTNVGSQYETSAKAVSIAAQYENGVHAAVGIHPVHAHKFEFKKERFVSMIRSSAKVVAVGETGMDFYHSKERFDEQTEMFIQHIRLAKEFDLALIIHGRNDKENTISCYQEILKIVRDEKVRRAVVHCYMGTADEAKRFLELGFFIGFTGIVTFKNAPVIQSVARDVVPLERLLIETDSPYLAPEPYRGKENKPQYVEFVARKVAELKEINYNTVERQTFQNAAILFRT